jgi:hypothetical protein
MTTAATIGGEQDYGSMDGATCFQPRIADESLPAKSIHGVFDNWITTSAP